MARSVRVFSGNLWWGRADPDRLVDLIRTYEVDVFAAQELGPDCAEAIASELAHGCLEPHSTYQGMGIALRYPGTYERIPLRFRDARRAALDPLDWPGLEAPIDLINVHFQAPHALLPFPSARVRRDQVAGLEAHLDARPHPARLVVGDYNATPAWPLYRRMTKRFEDGAALSARKSGARPAPTWGRRPGSPRRLRIDHALVDGLDVDGFRVVEIPGSDHSGLLFDCSPERLCAG